MKNKTLNLIILSIFIILFIIVASGVFTYKNIKKESIYNLKNLIESGNIEQIIIGENFLLLTTKNKEILKIDKEPNLSFWEIVKDLKINGDKLKDIKIISQSKELQNIVLMFLINILPILIIVFIFWYVFSRAQKGAGQIFTFSKSSIKVYNPNDPNKITFKDIADLEEAKEELMEVVEFLKNPDKFLKIGARIPKGVLLVGPPGSGKTMLARSVAAEAGVPFFYISGSEFMELFVGVGPARVRDAFSIAKRFQPSILFIDEIDAIGKARGIGITGAHEEREQTLNQILVEMDGFEKGTRVVVLAATNMNPALLDPALLRPGRFDRKIVLDLPDVKAREEILKIHLRDKRVGDVNLRQIAERTAGFSGADLANLCNEAAILAARRNKEYITQEELLDSIEKVLLGPERKTKVYSKKEKEVAAYHEAGHAIVSHYLPNSSPVQKISIIQRARAGGYTIKTPLEEKNFYFKKEFMDEIASLLGGYAAEKLIFNDVTTGAYNDLEIATQIARDLVIKFGMSEKLGPISFSIKPKELTFEKEYSEKTAEIIDEEIKRIIDEALERATKVLTIKKDKLEKIAKYLIKKETIEKKTFERLIGEKKGSLMI
jgi:cell division protease FtsH